MASSVERIDKSPQGMIRVWFTDGIMEEFISVDAAKKWSVPPPDPEKERKDALAKKHNDLDSL